MSGDLLFQFRHEKDAAPTVTEIASRFGFADGEISGDYGVVKVADENGTTLYTILVDAGARTRIEPQLREQGDPTVGFFSSPRIEPFGPPET